MKKISIAMGIILFGCMNAGFGYIAGKQSTLYQKPIHEIPDINPKVSLIEFNKISEGKLLGKVEGNVARLKTSQNVATTNKEGNFELNLNDLGLFNTKIEPVNIPEGAKYAASKNGKYAYPIQSKQAKNLSVKTRVYFQTLQEASDAGYKDGS